MIAPNKETLTRMDILRFTTAGSVDDGKSTLIGRLLYDSKAIFEDQWETLEKRSQSKGDENIDLASLTDGLKAEQEQGITIDVAYRFFATPRRKFVIADTPGHVQYTRNMVTGASTAQLAIVLIDARHGVITQSKRHAFLSSLLQIPHIVVAVNKMDLVDFDRDVFDKIKNDFEDFAQKLDVDDITFIPISALKGDNIVNKSENMPWYEGSSLLYHLENVHVTADKNMIDFRFPVQYVVRPHQDYRGLTGSVSSGIIRSGEEVTVLPSLQKSRIRSITTFDGEVERAVAGDSISIEVEDDLDISRGDMLVRTNNVPLISKDFEAYLCWMDQQAMTKDKPYIIRQTTRTARAVVKNILYRMNVDTMHREDADTLALNEIGMVLIETSEPLFLDNYRSNDGTGSFILIDPDTHVTVGGGMVRRIITTKERTRETGNIATKKSPEVVWSDWNIPRAEREKRNGHKAAVIWFTGISGAGKSTIATQLEKELYAEGKQTMLLDGDQVRHGLCGDLGFSPDDRRENIRRVGELARLFYEHGNIVLCTFVSPYREDREIVRNLIPDNQFIEVQVTCSPETAQKRDPKGLYEKARKGEIKGLTGFDAQHESAESPEIVINTDEMSVEEAVKILKEL